MQLAYTLMHGAGNRIAVIDERSSARLPPPQSTIAKLSESGPLEGFDQLMWLGPANDAALSYRVFNADGSEVEQCGNGVRCVARLLLDDETTELIFESPAGLVTARLETDGSIAVDMGGPRFDPDELPFIAATTAATYELEVEDQLLEVSALSMGNPHCVLRVDDVANAPVDTLGPAIERHDRFPARTNVGFMAVRNRSEIDLRVWERGVGETLACGTGACAAMVAAQRLGLVDTRVSVRLPGGELVVSWRGNAGDPVWLAGDAERTSEGSLTV